MSEPARRFEDLWIWQHARIQVQTTFHDFGPGTPASRDFTFRDQIDRAALSVMNNIAEGFEKSSDLDYARFLDNAKGSAGEVRSMYYAGEDRKYVSAEHALARREFAARLSAGIASLQAHLRRNK